MLGGVSEKPVVPMLASVEKARERAQHVQMTGSGWRTGPL